MYKSLASNGLTILIVVLLAAAWGVNWGNRQFTAEGPLSQAICLQVRSGATMSSVSKDLVQREAISSAQVFRIGADYTDRASKLKAGSFLVPAKASMDEIIHTITAGGRSTCGAELNYRIGVLRARVVIRELDPATNKYEDVAAFEPGVDAVPAAYTEALDDTDIRFRITLAEGATSWQMIESLKKVEFLTGVVEEVPAEGSLAPDSYEVVKGSDRAALVERMRDAQAKRLADLWSSRASDLPLETPEEALILASIVEKETGLAEERRQVASVFINRLNRGMKLQTDPTVIYGITKGEGALGRGLRQSELRGATPYNTYVIEGMPPTPIANPGRESIEAALNPDSTPFIFFVADGTGGHAFAETLEEHNKNVAEWRKIEAQRASE